MLSHWKAFFCRVEATILPVEAIFCRVELMIWPVEAIPVSAWISAPLVLVILRQNRSSLTDFTRH